MFAQSYLFPLRQSFDGIMTKWRKVIERARDPYRPELHYLRGPGPKWHAKHLDRAVTKSL
ncbi:hypothetical protein ACFFWD_00140 [Bradyrhizobium erythrophlei]|uniref:hypothetical protein n=1 Tax=Bradyrhizobium erythrophlei TaxID=1437360 RepID=UPI0035E673B6